MVNHFWHISMKHLKHYLMIQNSYSVYANLHIPTFYFTACNIASFVFTVRFTNSPIKNPVN